MLLSVALATPIVHDSPGPVAPQSVAEKGMAIKARKILTTSLSGQQVVDNGVLLIKNGKIEAVGRARDIKIPEGYEVLDVGERWLAPGMVELHDHEAGASLYSGVNDLNDTVFLANPGMRASTAVEPSNHSMKMAVAGGVTTVLYIPGSGSNIGGQGVLVKTGHPTYNENLLRDPGSMKLAQYGNPERWGMGVRMAFEHWNTRTTLRIGKAYAERWASFEAGQGPEPVKNINYDVFRDLLAGEIVISTHTQIYQVVLMTLTMVAMELELPVILDHSTIGGWLLGAMAEELKVPAIVGPRSVDPAVRGMIEWAHHGYEGFRGIAAGYQERGHTMVGFNTDAPVIPQEELSVNAAMAARYGFKDMNNDVMRGLSIVPAKAARIDHLVGSLEVGKHADILVTTGHPADPRTAIDLVFMDGKRVYDAERDGRRW
jgi:imidazolonepropionase-like amidohydrolase